MTLLDCFNTFASVVSLALGYMSAHGQFQKFWRTRKLPKLLNEKEFYERLQSSPSERQAYLLETLVLLFAIAGAGTMFGAVQYASGPAPEAFEGLRLWILGGILYMFSLYRLGKYWNVTRRYQNTIDRLAAEIRKNNG